MNGLIGGNGQERQCQVFGRGGKDLVGIFGCNIENMKKMFPRKIVSNLINCVIKGTYGNDIIQHDSSCKEIVSKGRSSLYEDGCRRWWRTRMDLSTPLSMLGRELCGRTKEHRWDNLMHI